MEPDKSNLIRVKIVKRTETGLGFLIQSRTEKPHVVISAMVSGGMAEKSGLIRIGDTILRVNDTDITDKVYEDCVDLLKSLPTDSPVSLLLKGPDGYTSYLHTTFLENGAPHTVRITKPLQNNDSFVSRLRRTFGRSLSPTNRISIRQSRRGTEGSNQSNNKSECDQTCFVCPIEHENHAKLQNAESQTEADTGKPSSAINGKSIVNSSEKSVNINNNSLSASPKIITNGVPGESSAQLNVTSVNGTGNPTERRESLRSPSAHRKESMSHNSPAQQKKYVKIKNVADSKLVYTDTLHTKVIDVS